LELSETLRHGERKEMKRKWLSVGIILLFVGTGIIPAIAQDTEKTLPASRGNWLYVGGSGPGNYTRIQDAINDSSDGDTVFVYDESSPYYEHLKITHQVNLIGENKETTIIDGNGNMNTTIVLLLDNSNGRNVTISGFTIRDGHQGILVWTDNNVISGNIIDNTSTGIWLGTGSDGNTVADNIITHTTLGVGIDYSFQNKIYENSIEDNIQGIRLYSNLAREYGKNILFFDEGLPNDIYNNTIRNNTYGIIVTDVSWVNISYNDIINNSYGIDLELLYWGGLLCSNNTIFQNNISRNEHGITLYNRGSMKGNGGTGDWGIRYNTIVENNIAYNAKGIEITNYMRHGIGFNTFSHNNFIGNTQTVNLENTIYNHWVGNYWETPRLLPYPIIGKIMIFRHIIPWINFDWHPTQEPYDIGV
jgi:parallel beta-helix repeat protein